MYMYYAYIYIYNVYIYIYIHTFANIISALLLGGAVPDVRDEDLGFIILILNV